MVTNNINTVSLGVMSGTSLDGLDLALCRFYKEDQKWEYSIIDCTTIDYPADIRRRLSDIENASALELLMFHNKYGLYIAEQCQHFLSRNNNIQTDIIASHGHTIFHQPENRFTFQIGSGAVIAANTGIDTVCDFRTVDVALSGQGAPLVPIGDKYLFADYDYCLNLGGFANISTQNDDTTIAWDICPINIVMNHITRQQGKEFDNNGEIARKGKLNKSLFDKLNSIDFFSRKAPKSLGKEWVLKEYLPLLEEANCPPEDILHTVCHSGAYQIAQNINGEGKSIFTTGGGSKNTFFIELLKKYCNKNSIIIPSGEIIDFKEAVIFAFLGILFQSDEINTLATVTGAIENSIAGCLYKGKR